MAESLVQIYNIALGWLGGHQLSTTSASWEDSREGQLCQVFFPQVRDECLAAYKWSFATRRQELALAPSDSPEAIEPFSHAYALPSDYLKAIGFSQYQGSPQDLAPPYQIEEDKLLTCLTPPANLIYVARITDPKRYPPKFVLALSYGLAAFLATANANDPKIKQECQKQQYYYLGAARAEELNSQHLTKPSTPWQRARRGIV